MPQCFPWLSSTSMGLYEVWHAGPCQQDGGGAPCSDPWSERLSFSLCPSPLAAGMGTPVCHQLGSALCVVWGFVEGGGVVLLWGFVVGLLFWFFYLTLCCQNTTFLTKKMQKLET